MKIAHILGYFQPKLGYQEYYLALKQQELGHEVFVITSDRNYPYPSFKETYGHILGERFIGAGTFTEKGIKVVRLPCMIEFKDQIFVRGLLRALKEIKPDVVHVHDEFSQLEIISFLARVLFKKQLKYRLFLDCHADYINQSNSPIRHFFFSLIAKNPLHKWLILTADGYTGINNASCIWLSQELGIKFRNIYCIPLGVDTHLFLKNYADRAEVRTKLRINYNDIVIIYTGKFIPIKDLDILLYASATLIHEHENLKILLVGSGPDYYVRYLKKIIDEMKLGDKIIIHEFVRKEELPKFYSSADLAIWPGGPSISIQEAISTSLPVIIIQNDSVLHLIKYRNGLSFTRGNIEALKKCIASLIENEVLRVEMGRRSRIFAEEKLSWTHIAQQTLNIYELTLNKSPTILK